MSQDEAPIGPYLTWELRPEKIPDHAGTNHWWFQDAVVLHAPDGAVVWRRELPARCRGWQVGIGDAEVEGHKSFPRTIQGLSFVIGLEWTEGAVAFADRTGVLVLARKDGAVLLDAPFESATDFAQTLWFDSGSFTLGECTGKGRGGKFFARCGGEWIYFNGTTLAAIDIATPRATATARFDPAKHKEKLGPAEVRATIPLGERAVEIRGVIFLR